MARTNIQPEYCIFNIHGQVITKKDYIGFGVDRLEGKSGR